MPGQCTTKKEFVPEANRLERVADNTVDILVNDRQPFFGIKIPLDQRVEAQHLILLAEGVELLGRRFFSGVDDSGEEPSPQELDTLSKQYEVLSLNPLIQRYFDAEKRLAVVYEDINRIVGSSLQSVLLP